MRRGFAARAFASLLLTLLAFPAAAAEFREFNSRHYRIYTDLDPILADDLARRMDQMYDQYAARLRQFVTGKEAMPRFECAALSEAGRLPRVYRSAAQEHGGRVHVRQTRRGGVPGRTGAGWAEADAAARGVSSVRV